MGKAHEAMSTTAYDDAVPPPYSAPANAVQATPYPSGNALSGAGPYRPFPPTFTAYYQKKLLTTVFHLGESPSEPLFAVKIPGISTSGVVLHNGPSVDDAPLASATSQGKMSTNTRVTLPPLPGSGDGSSTEVMRTKMGLHTSYQFSVEVGNNGRSRREDFEWRSSSGKDIEGLVRKPGRGHKLVRLGSNGKGDEVVAFWSRNHSWSMTKGYEFQFLGSGLTGEMGQRWAIMAVITALRIWYIELVMTGVIVASS